MEKVFNIALTQAELNLVVAGIGKLPMEQVAGLYQSIQQQFIAQTQQTPTPEVKDAVQEEGKQVCVPDGPEVHEEAGGTVLRKRRKVS